MCVCVCLVLSASVFSSSYLFLSKIVIGLRPFYLFFVGLEGIEGCRVGMLPLCIAYESDIVVLAD